MNRSNYHAIGIMSGTSLDGLDLAYCRFERTKRWKFSILAAETMPYSPSWKRQLSDAHRLRGDKLLHLHHQYGRFIGLQCQKFIRRHRVGQVDLVASHGHTIFHQPERSLTFQLGAGEDLFSATRLPVVCDFRTLDVALGGQGAPLVPVGDRELFGQHEVCLNLGGIANISMEAGAHRKARDVCFVNMALNHLAEKKKKMFDRDGAISFAGKANQKWIRQVEDFYRPLRRRRPSLSREIFETGLRPLLDDRSLSTEDKMASMNECIAAEIRRAIDAKRKGSILVTGGGAFNSALLQNLSGQFEGQMKLRVPDRETIEFKEALVFAFLGVLRLRNEVNVFSSVTGARTDSCSGAIIG